MASNDVPPTGTTTATVQNPIILYSSYGYVEVDKSELNSESLLISFKKLSFLHGRLNKTQLRDTITISLKTFHGSREVYLLKVSITEKLSELINKLIKEEESIQFTEKKWKRGNQYRLICTAGILRELNPMKNYIEECISEDSLLLLLPTDKLCFSEAMKGPGVWLDQRCKVASKHDSDEHQYVLTEKGYTFGKHYCEFTLETEPLEKSIIIGASLKRTEYSLSDVKGFVGYILSDAKKISNTTGKFDQVEYGEVGKIGDKVGLMIEFTSTGCDVTFFLNKVSLGTAFKNLPFNTYYPCAALGIAGTKIRITNKVEFPDI